MDQVEGKVRTMQLRIVLYHHFLYICSLVKQSSEKAENPEKSRHIQKNYHYGI